MQGLAAFFLWAILGVAVGWAGAVAKAALLANDPGWAGTFYIVTCAIWIGGLFLGSILIARGFQACGIWFTRTLTTWCGVLTVLLCGLSDLSFDYLLWRKTQPANTPPTLTAWWQQDSTKDVISYSRRHGATTLPQGVQFALQLGVAALIVVSGCSGLGYDPEDDR